MLQAEFRIECASSAGMRFAANKVWVRRNLSVDDVCFREVHHADNGPAIRQVDMSSAARPRSVNL